MSYRTTQTMNNCMLMRTEEDVRLELEEAKATGWLCPICSEAATMVSNCDRRQSTCVNSHQWYMKDGVVTIGDCYSTPPEGMVFN